MKTSLFKRFFKSSGVQLHPILFQPLEPRLLLSTNYIPFENIESPTDFSIYTDQSLTTPGLTGAYINSNLKFTDILDWRLNQTIAGQRIDNPIDFTTATWGIRSELGLTGGNDANWDQYSVQWDGVVQINNMTRLQLTNDDSARFWIDYNLDGVFHPTNELIDSSWGKGQFTTTGPPSQNLSPGLYNIRIQYAEGLWDNDIKLHTFAIPTVRVGYVIPSNRTPQTNAIQNIQNVIPMVQKFYLEQMDRWGFGRKTFHYESQPDGITPKVHVINIDVTDEFIAESVWNNTINAMTNAGVTPFRPNDTWIIYPESHIQQSDSSIIGTVALGAGTGHQNQGGLAMLPSYFLSLMNENSLMSDDAYNGTIVPSIGPYPLVYGVSFAGFTGSTVSQLISSHIGAIAHELGHAFGLPHDFRNDDNFQGNLMGNGLRGFRGAYFSQVYTSDDIWISYGNALRLNLNRFFNTNQIYLDNNAPTLTINTSGNVTPINGLLEINFSASSNNELALAVLHTGSMVTEMTLQGTQVNASFKTHFWQNNQPTNYYVKVFDVEGNLKSQYATITPSNGTSHAPTPYIIIERTHSAPGQNITFNPSKSNDPDHPNQDALLSVDWDFDGDGIWDTTATADQIITHAFPAAGHYQTFARITDSDGEQSLSTPIPIRIDTPPRVTHVSFGSDQWNDAFRALIDPTYHLGYTIPFNAPLNSLPWIGLNQISFKFNQHVHVREEDLNYPDLNVNSFNYDHLNYIATWTFDNTIPNGIDWTGINDTIRNIGLLQLDGEWLGTFPSGNGLAGADFQIQYKVMTGNLNNDFNIDQRDIDDLLRYLKSNELNPDIPTLQYLNLDGQNNIDANDADALVKDILATEFGDTNLDRKINIIDLAKLASNYQRTDAGWIDGDFNGDHIVNIADLAILASNYNFDNTTTGAAAIETQNHTNQQAILNQHFSTNESKKIQSLTWIHINSLLDENININLL